MRNIKRLSESDLNRIVKKVINEQQSTDDGKSELIQVLINKLNYMKNDSRFTGDDVCEVTINNCNHFKNKTDIFASK